MELEILSKQSLIKEGPAYFTQECHTLQLLFEYIKDKKDLNVLQGIPIKKITTIDIADLWRFEFEDGYTIEIDIAAVSWLKSHNYMSRAIFYKDKLLELYKRIKDLDIYPLTVWKIEKDFYFQPKNIKEKITYNRNTIYVNGHSTGLPFTYETYDMVIKNINFWEKGFELPRLK